MSYILKNITIVDSGSSLDNTKQNVWIDNGIIKGIGKDSFSAAKVYDCDQYCVSAGWIDIRAELCEPGNEHKETLDSGIKMAQNAGFTALCVAPNTDPIIQTKDLVRNLVSRNGNLVDFLPLASPTLGLKGKDMTEMLDLAHAGAIAFSNHLAPISNAGTLLKLLKYLKNTGKTLMVLPQIPDLIEGGQMNEGNTSTMLGLAGIPSFSEHIAIKSALEVLEYSDGRLHFNAISTTQSVELIRKAKKDGLQVTCDVNFYSLAFSDEVMTDFDTNYKVMPPFRTKNDIKALIKGLEDGVIDAIASNHSPQDSEAKNIEFDYAAFGMLGIEFLFPVLNKKIDYNLIVKSITKGARKVLGLPEYKIVEGAAANLTVFDPKVEWQLTKKESKSLSHNTPFFGQDLRGMAVGIINQKKSFFKEVFTNKIVS